MDTFYANPDGTIPTDRQAYAAQQLAPVAVNPNNNRLFVDAVITNDVPTTNGTLTGATKTVAATGTPEALGTGTCRELFIFPLRTNTGQAYWGTEATNDTQHGTVPVVITAPEGKLIDISSIYIDVTVNGEGVRYIKSN